MGSWPDEDEHWVQRSLPAMARRRNMLLPLVLGQSVLATASFTVELTQGVQRSSITPLVLVGASAVITWTVTIDEIYRERLRRVQLTMLAAAFCLSALATVLQFVSSSNGETDWGMWLCLLSLIPGYLAMAPAMVRRLADRRLDRLRSSEISIAQARLEGLRQASSGRDVYIDIDDYDSFRRDVQAANILDAMGRSIQLSRLSISGSRLFADMEYTFAPGVNVLLGRNGYGKSQLLRLIAATMQQHKQTTSIGVGSPDGTFRCTLDTIFAGEVRRISLHDTKFARGGPGVLPVLAIPDSRWVDRSRDTIAPPDPGLGDPVVDAASHFIEQRPYTQIVARLLYELALDEYSPSPTASLPPLLLSVMSELGNDAFRLGEVTRAGGGSLRLTMYPVEGGDAVPVQQASQGSLSLLSVFGLIRTYLDELDRHPDRPSDARSVVIIDELDAHLHPTWQVMTVPLLRRYFPNTQFILTAQNPLMVAGARAGEVSVLRAGADGFLLRQYERDFVGANVGEILEDVFSVDGPDLTLLEYRLKSNDRDELAHERAELAESLTTEAATPATRERLEFLDEELHLIDKSAAIVRRQARRREHTARGGLADDEWQKPL